MVLSPGGSLTSVSPRVSTVREARAGPAYPLSNRGARTHGATGERCGQTPSRTSPSAEHPTGGCTKRTGRESNGTPGLQSARAQTSIRVTHTRSSAPTAPATLLGAANAGGPFHTTEHATQMSKDTKREP